MTSLEPLHPGLEVDLNHILEVGLWKLACLLVLQVAHFQSHTNGPNASLSKSRTTALVKLQNLFSGYLKGRYVVEDISPDAWSRQLDTIITHFFIRDTRPFSVNYLIEAEYSSR